MFPIITTRHRAVALAIATVMTVIAFASAPGVLATNRLTPMVQSTAATFVPDQSEQAMEGQPRRLENCRIDVAGRTSGCTVVKPYNVAFLSSDLYQAQFRRRIF